MDWLQLLRRMASYAVGNDGALANCRRELRERQRIADTTVALERRLRTRDSGDERNDALVPPPATVGA